MAGISDYMDIAKLQAQQQATDQANQQLQDALKGRESFGYSLASALSALPQQQGYGNWGNAALNAFGNAFNARINNAIDRAQQNYKSLSGQQQADLAAALKFAQASSADDVRKYQIAQAAQAKAEKEAQDMRDLDYVNASANTAIDLINENPDAMTKFKQSDWGDWTKSKSDREVSAQVASYITPIVQQITAIQREGGAAASMMNSDADARRAFGYLNDPSSHTGSELKWAIEKAQEYINFKKTGELPANMKGKAGITKTREEYENAKGTSTGTGGNINDVFGNL